MEFGYGQPIALPVIGIFWRGEKINFIPEWFPPRGIVFDAKDLKELNYFMKKH